MLKDNPDYSNGFMMEGAAILKIDLGFLRY